MPSIADRLERQLTADQVRLLRGASTIAAERGARLYLVGGAVRDLLLGGRPVDLDVVADGADDGLPDALAAGLGGEVTARSRFDTAKLDVEGLTLDLARARTETYSRPGALPDVSPGTMRQDAARRDFSMSAMATSLGESDWGDLLDPHGGAADIRARLVRVLHAGSFVDDATRIVRTVRYAGRLGFQIEPETRGLLERDLGRLDTISGDRLRRELQLLLAEDRWPTCLGLARDHGVLAAVHPALALEGAPLDVLDAHASAPEAVRLSATLSLAPPDQVGAAAARLDATGEWAAIARDVAGLAGTLDLLDSPHIARSRVYALLHNVSPTAAEGVALTCGRPRAAERMRLYFGELRHVRPMLDGNDLLALGVPQGPRVGEILAALLDARLDGLVSTREEEETYVSRALAAGWTDPRQTPTGL